MNSKEYSKIFRNLSLVTYIGIMMSLPIIAAIYLGNWVDKRFETGNIFLFIFLILGIVSGFLNVYKIVMIDLKKKKQ